MQDAAAAAAPPPRLAATGWWAKGACQPRCCLPKQCAAAAAPVQSSVGCRRASPRSRPCCLHCQRHARASQPRGGGIEPPPQAAPAAFLCRALAGAENAWHARCRVVRGGDVVVMWWALLTYVCSPRGAACQQQQSARATAARTRLPSPEAAGWRRPLCAARCPPACCALVYVFGARQHVIFVCNRALLGGASSRSSSSTIASAWD